MDLPERTESPAEICTDAEVAAGRTATGVDVVVVVAPGVPFVTGRAGPGRVAVFVGGADEAVDRAAASTMANEIFG